MKTILLLMTICNFNERIEPKDPIQNYIYTNTYHDQEMLLEIIESNK